VNQAATEVTASRVRVLPAEPPCYLTVTELSAALGQSERTTRQLLNHGLIPGARRMDPRAGRSPWLIPLDASEKYLEQFYERAS
jgi:Helix-turn-helix domain